MGFDDEVEEAKAELEKKRQDEELQRQNTLAQMEKNKQEADDNRKLVAELSQAMGVHQIQEDLDVLKNALDKINQNVVALNESIVKIVGVVDQHTHILNGTQQAQPAGAASYTPNEQKIKDLVDVAKGLAEAYKTFKGESTAAQPLISQELINEKMTNAFMDDLATGENIRKFISDSLKKKATQQIVKQSLGNIGVPTHEPE